MAYGACDFFVLDLELRNFYPFHLFSLRLGFKV